MRQHHYGKVARLGDVFWLNAARMSTALFRLMRQIFAPWRAWPTSQTQWKRHWAISALTASLANGKNWAKNMVQVQVHPVADGHPGEPVKPNGENLFRAVK